MPTISWKKEKSYPLYLKLADTIREKILNNELKPNQSLPPENQFSKELDVCHITLRNALKVLEKEGYINRIRGKGTFVKDVSRKQNSELLVCLFMENQGHIHEAMYQSLSGKLQKQNLFPIILNKQGGDVYEQSKYQIDYALGLNPKAIVIDRSDYEFAYDYLKNKKSKLPHLIFLNPISEHFSFDGDYVLQDRSFGMYSLTKHFIELGHKKISFIAHPDLFKTNFDDGPPIESGMSGYLSAMEDSGLSKNQTIFNYTGDKDKDRENLVNHLSQANRPTAIIGAQDNRAVWAMDIAQELGLKIPDDLAIAGYFDTPWCQRTNPQLTSVSIQEEIISKTVADRVFADERNYQKTMIKPELVIRESSVPKKKGKCHV